MMRATSNSTSSTGSSDLVFSHGGHSRPLTIVRRAGARGMRLSVDPRDATVRLTLATRAPLRPALAWAAGKRTWVEDELRRLPAPRPIVPGLVFDVAGEVIELDWAHDRARRVRLVPGRLIVGGPLDQLPGRVLRFLRTHALVVLERETRALAAAHSIGVGSVGVGDAKGRWGSCTASGNLRYSWRLILASDFVRRATVAHEVAHCVHMNHGPAFHALARSLYGGDPAHARAWLRAHGTTLHWFGRD